MLAGEMFIIRFVTQLPPKLYWRSLVNFESRYGICDFLPSLKIFITFPRTDKLVLIFFAYYRCLPSTPVLEIFSQPAKSTRISFEALASPV